MTEGPPALTSERYATDFNQVKSWGAVDSTVRIGGADRRARRLWAGVGTSTTFTRLEQRPRRRRAQRGLSGLDTARAFALLNMTFHDALLTSFTGKFVYGLWRPVTAIREADTDGNARHRGRPGWTPLAADAALSERIPATWRASAPSLSRVLERVFGQDNVPFSVTWTGTTGPDDDAELQRLPRARRRGGLQPHLGRHPLPVRDAVELRRVRRLADYAVDNVLRRR